MPLLAQKLSAEFVEARIQHVNQSLQHSIALANAQQIIRFQQMNLW
jgi:hypothetical protein